MPAVLRDGDHHIGKPSETTTRTGEKTYRCPYSLKTPGGKLIRSSAFGATAAAAKRAARAKIEERLQTGTAGKWKPSSKLAKFANDETTKLINEADLRPRTRDRYAQVLDIALGNCDCRKHPTLDGFTVADGLTHDHLRELIQGVATEHGSETSHQLLSVLKKYIVRPARSRGLITVDPLEGFSARSVQRSYRGPGEQRDVDAVLSEVDYWRVVDFLIARDDSRPASVSAPTKHNYARGNSAEKWINARDHLLLAAGTGLRANEVSSLIWSDVTSKDGRVYVLVSAEVSKTKRARVVPILPEVADHLLRRRGDADEDAFVIGSPADGSVRWDQANRDRALAALFLEMSSALDLPVLARDFRAHGFRHTLSSIWAARGVGVELRARWFGHTVAMNRDVYTDLDSLDQVAAAMKRVDTGGHLAAV